MAPVLAPTVFTLVAFCGIYSADELRRIVLTKSASVDNEERFIAAMAFPDTWRFLSAEQATKVASTLLADKDVKIVREMLLGILAMGPAVDEAARFLEVVRPLKKRLKTLSAKGTEAGVRSLSKECIDLIEIQENALRRRNK